MAAGITYTCGSCGDAIHSWDDGNPYLEYPEGTRTYFYHPDGDRVISEVGTKILGRTPEPWENNEILEKYAGNAPNHICRECEEISRIDLKKDEIKCAHCNSTALLQMHNLGGKKCLKCDGTFGEGMMTAVS